jgi:hypothetical protein
MVVVWLCALAGSLVLGVCSAPAFLTHEFFAAPSKEISEGVPSTGPHGESVPVPGPLGEIKSMTVDSGELYVAEGVEKSMIDKFDVSSGAFVSQLPQLASPAFLHQGVTVGHSTGEAQLYVGGDEPNGSHIGVVAVLGPAGGLLGEWKGADTPSKAFGCFECSASTFASTSMAVDANPSNLTDWASGDVYVTDLEHRVVDVFKPLAGGGEQYVTQLTGPEPPNVTFSDPVGVAVDPSTGDVVVADREPGVKESGSVYIFRPAPIVGQYELVKKLAGPSPTESFVRINGVTVDGGNGHIYVWEEGRQASVDEFDSEGVYLSRLLGTPTGAPGEIRPFESVGSVTVDPESHHVYIASFNREKQVGFVDVFGGDLVIPDVTTEAASGVGPLSATLNGTVNPDKEGEASCRFEWGTTKAFGQTAPCEPEKVSEGSSPVGVHALLNGVLQPDTTYYYRLQASNKNGTNPGEALQDQQFTTPGPGLHAESVSDISSTSATLEASVNPHNVPTSYYFQYGKGAEYEAQAPLAPGAPLGSGEGDVEVSRHLQGLSPNTLYHYRVVAVGEIKPGELETFAAADQTFVTQAAGSALALPDARQWELVSPPDKHGSQLPPISETSQIQAAVSGGAMTYLATLPTESVKGYVEGDLQVMSTRGVGGWSSRDITLPHAAATGFPASGGPEYRFFSPDLSSGLIQPWGEFTSLAPESFPADSERTPYVRHNSTCASTPATCFEPLLTAAPGYADVPQGTKFGGAGGGFGPVRFVGGSGDLTHVIFATSVQLTSTPTGGKDELYEWSANRQGSEKLQLVSLLPANAKGEEIPAEGGPTLGFQNNVVRHAVSEDGSRIAWSTPNHIYMRDVLKGETVQLDAPEAECPSTGKCGDGGVSPAFQLASSEGSRVLFTDTQRLTKDAGTSRSSQRDLYECDMVESAGRLRCELSDLTPASVSVEAAGVQGAVIGSSEDGSWVYFVANGVLGDGAEHSAVQGSCKVGSPQAEGACNLYMYHGGVTSFIAVVAGEDDPDWAGFSGKLDGLTARVSPGGRWLAFMSSRPLTGYDNRDAFSGKPDEEVFTYHAETSGPGSLVCASCDPTGARPEGVEYEKLNSGLVGGNNVWRPGTWIAANIPGWTPYYFGRALYQSRYLSDDGRLFFNSSDALVPQDINKNEDVYEYEPVGVGDCSSSSSTFNVRSGGCATLISSGTAVGESAFMDASENGSDVFFMTGEKLVAQDVDTALDLYDAHACTAVSPCPNVPTSPPACTTADACRAAPASQPSLFGSPASATFAGVGNVTQAGSGAVKPRSLSRAQKLNRALSACRKKVNGKKARARRRVCERQAKRRYGARKANVLKKGKG